MSDHRSRKGGHEENGNDLTKRAYVMSGQVGQVIIEHRSSAGNRSNSRRFQVPFAPAESDENGTEQPLGRNGGESIGCGIGEGLGSSSWRMIIFSPRA